VGGLVCWGVADGVAQWCCCKGVSVMELMELLLTGGGVCRLEPGGFASMQRAAGTAKYG